MALENPSVRRLDARLGVARRLALAGVVVLGATVAGSPTGLPSAWAETAPVAPPSGGGIRAFQARLEAESVRILGTEVTGPMKAPLAARGTSLWTCVSIAQWQRQVVAEAPTLARSVEVLGRRAEVLWGEARTGDAHTIPLAQMASVHAMQRGLVRVLAQLGVRSTPPPPAVTTPSHAAVRSGDDATRRAAATPTSQGTGAMPVRTQIERPRPQAPLAPQAPPVLSPVQLAVYSATLEQEAARILAAEVEGPVLAAVAVERPARSSATTVSAWTEAMVRAHPGLSRTTAVLARRAEVLRESVGVRDPYTSAATQQAAVRGLERGVSRLLSQYGR